jgi:hypothetical protein
MMTNDERISALRDEAGKAGDLAMVAICDRALDDLDTDSRIDDEQAVQRALALTVDQARAECYMAMAIAEAQN